MGIMNQRYLTYPEAQDLYGVSKRTLQKLVVSGAVEAFRPGKETLMDSVMLEQWFRSTKIKPRAVIGRPRRGAVRR